MNIVFYYDSIDLGGQQTQTLQLARRIKSRGHNVSWAYTRGDELRSQIEECVLLHHLPVRLDSGTWRKYPWRIFQLARRIASHARNQQAEVIISGSGIGSLCAGLAARWLRIGHYRLVGCSLVQVEPTLYRYYRKCKIDSLIDGYFGWPGVFEELRRKGVAAHKFIELNNAVDTDMFVPSSPHGRSEIRRKMRIQDDELVIGWIGRISADMQVGNTVELAAELRRRGFHRFRLLFVGGGPWVDGIKQLIADYNLTDITTITGWVPMHDVCEYVNAMDIIPLLEADPHGGSIVREAMACGRVAISVDGRSGTQRRFMKPDCTILVEPTNFITRAADAIARLASDSKEASRLGANARTYAEKAMSFETQVDTILATIGA